MTNNSNLYMRITKGEMKEQTDSSYWAGVMAGAAGALLAVFVVYFLFIY